VDESPEPPKDEPVAGRDPDQEPEPVQQPPDAGNPRADWAAPPAGPSPEPVAPPGAPAPPPGWSGTPPSGGWPAPPPPGWSAAPPQGIAPQRGRFSVLAGILVGIGAFIVSAIVGASIVIASLGASYNGNGMGSLVGLALTFLIAPIVAIVMLFRPRLRPGAAGILIVFAAGWILLVGPCVAPAFVGYPA